jgi:hypothetical protein
MSRKRLGQYEHEALPLETTAGFLVYSTLLQFACPQTMAQVGNLLNISNNLLGSRGLYLTGL